MSLHGPAGACIPVASASPIHVFPIQCVLKHCGVHKHSLYIYSISSIIRTSVIRIFDQSSEINSHSRLDQEWNFTVCTCSIWLPVKKVVLTIDSKLKILDELKTKVDQKF